MATDVASPPQDRSLSPLEGDVALPLLDIPVSFAGQTHVFHLPADAVLDDLTLACKDQWGAKTEDGSDGDDNDDGEAAAADYDWSAHKFIAPPPVGLLKASDHDRPLAPLFAGAAGRAAGPENKKKKKSAPVRLLATRVSDVQGLRAAQEVVRRLAARRRHQRSQAVRAQPTRRPDQQSTPYTFAALRPLPHLPHPERSLAFLQRLRDDVGVCAAMRAHQFSVGLLTEMDPLLHTASSHEGTTRTLGLNRNQGQVIELRLRTDAGDGYRDYRTVRRTLCHELAHNVHGPHDSQFWALCHALEREVDRADYRGSGQTLSEYGPPETAADYDDDDDKDHTDAGGWTGGSFVLGGTTAATGAASPPTSAAARRDLAAQAAEERMRRLAEERQRQRRQDDDRESSQQ